MPVGSPPVVVGAGGVGVSSPPGVDLGDNGSGGASPEENKNYIEFIKDDKILFNFVQI